MGQGESKPRRSSSASRRQGTCRVCFEDGGELIAPCKCTGTSKWIHRECLDQWRSTGDRPQAMSHCSVCGSEYQLVLKRSGLFNTPLRNLARRIASQTIIGLLIVQLIILILALLICAVDTNQRLVKVFNFSTERNHQALGGFTHAIRYHAVTYYVAGVLAFMALFGLPVLALMTRDAYFAIRTEGIRSQIRSCHCICPCLLCNGGLAASVFLPFTPPPTLLGFVLVALGGLVTLGTLCFVVGIVMAIQFYVRECARVQQAHVIAREYTVIDLADPEERGESSSDDDLLVALSTSFEASQVSVVCTGVGGEELCSLKASPGVRLMELQKQIEGRLNQSVKLMNGKGEFLGKEFGSRSLHDIFETDASSSAPTQPELSSGGSREATQAQLRRMLSDEMPWQQNSENALLDAPQMPARPQYGATGGTTGASASGLHQLD